MAHKHPPVTIHKAALADAKAITRLANQLARHEGSDTCCDVNRVKALMQSDVEPRCHFLVAKRETITIGFALFYAGYDLSSDTHGSHLADICIEKAERRKGIGRILLAHLAAATLAEGREWISFTVLSENSAARDFYLSLGFSEVAVSFMAAGRQHLSSLVALVGCDSEMNVLK